jgi:hypothetical protein
MRGSLLRCLYVFFGCALLKLNMLLVEAAGVEPDIGIENM